MGHSGVDDILHARSALAPELIIWKGQRLSFDAACYHEPQILRVTYQQPTILLRPMKGLYIAQNNHLHMLMSS